MYVLEKLPLNWDYVGPEKHETLHSFWGLIDGNLNDATKVIHLNLREDRFLWGGAFGGYP